MLTLGRYLVMKGYWGDEKKTKEVMIPDADGTVWMHVSNYWIQYTKPFPAANVFHASQPPQHAHPLLIRTPIIRQETKPPSTPTATSR